MNLYQPTITGSLSVSGSVNISGSITIAGGGTISGTASIATTALTASFVANAQTASYVLNAVSSSFALTASSADNLLVRNTLTATTLVVQTVTSSVIYSSGSNVFGNSLANTQTFTGSVSMNPGGLFVSSSGNVGIGNTAPATKLDVTGTIRPIGQTDPTSGVGMELFYRAADTSSYLQSYDRTSSAWKDVRIYGNTLYFGSQGNNNLAITSTGATLGVISGPTSFNIDNLAAQYGNIIYRESGVGKAYLQYLSSTFSDAARQNSFEIGTNAASSFIAFRPVDTEKMRITAAGNVGIGITNPSRKLEVVNSSNGYSAGISGTTYGIRFDNGGSYAFGGSTIHGVDNTLTGTYQILGLNGSEIVFGTSYTERMRIASTGTVTKPNQPAFQVTRGISGNQVITSGVDEILQFNTVRFDTQSNFNTSTYRFVAPVAGRYQFNATVRFDNTTAGGYLRTYFTVNGSSGTGGSYNYGHVILGSGGFSTSYQGISISAVISLSAADYVMVQGGHTTRTEFQGESQFSGYLLG